jgi:AraC-like DNA-binding protein
LATLIGGGSWTTTDLDDARHRLECDFGAQLRIGDAAATHRPMSVDRRAAAGFQIDTVRLPTRLSFDCADSDRVIVNIMRAGRIGGDGASQNFRYQRGDVYLSGFPGAQYRCHTDHTHVEAVVIPTRFLIEATGTTSALRFLSVNPVTPAAAAVWKATVAQVQRILDDPAMHTPLVLCEAGRMLSERIVATFPTTTTPGPAQLGRLMPVDLRRVLAYMEENAHTDISVWDIARAVDLTPAGVAYLFRRHLGSTPMAHLRRIRLDRAHRELVESDRSRATVGRVAAHWGFSRPATFATFYRSCYGQSPYATIRE